MPDEANRRKEIEQNRAPLDDIQPTLAVPPAALHALPSLHQSTAMIPQPEVVESHLGAEQARLNNGQNTGRTEA